MRLKATAKPDEYKVWLTDDELGELRRSTMNPRDDLVIQLGGYVGLRAFETPQIHPEHVKRTADGDHYRLRVLKGKDTTGNGGKPRDASPQTSKAISTATRHTRTSPPRTHSPISPSVASGTSSNARPSALPTKPATMTSAM